MGLRLRGCRRVLTAAIAISRSVHASLFVHRLDREHHVLCPRVAAALAATLATLAALAAAAAVTAVTAAAQPVVTVTVSAAVAAAGVR